LTRSRLNLRLLRHHRSSSGIFSESQSEIDERFTVVSRRDFLKLSGLAVAGLPSLFGNKLELVGNEERLALVLDGLERWVIEPSAFAGRPKLVIGDTSGDDFRFALSGARFPGTRFRADFQCDLKRGFMLDLFFPGTGWRFAMPVIEWLRDEFVATTTNNSGINLVYERGVIGTPQVNVDTVRFHSDWSFQFESTRLSHFILSNGSEVNTRQVDLLLPRDKSSLFAHAPNRRSILQVHRGDNTWRLIPELMQRELRLIDGEDHGHFDQLLIEFAENSHGRLRSAAIAENVRPVFMALDNGGNLMNDSGEPFVLPIAHSRLAAYKDEEREEFVFVGHLPDEPVWMHGNAFSVAISEHSRQPSIELAVQEGRVTTARVCPGLKSVEIPIPGADFQTSTVPLEARLPFSWGSVACSPKSANRSERPSNSPCSVLIDCKETLFSLNGCKITVVRPADFLNLTFEFWDICVRAVNGVPKLFPDARAGAGKPSIVVYFPPQTIAEEAFPEPGTKPSGTSKKRIGGLTRLAFDLVNLTKKDGMELSLDSLLDWTKFQVSLPPNAAYDPSHPIGAAPKPAAPDLKQTAIEIPFRLLLSPSPGVHWDQTNKPDLNRNRKVELWRTRVDDDAIRAVWSRDYPVVDWPKGSNPTDPPNADNDPFITTLDRRDRFQITHLSSDFTIVDPAFPGWSPKAINTKRLLLTSLGGWLDCNTEWEQTPYIQWNGNAERLVVSAWQHIATMGRDHYTRVVYEGFLFPVGHRALLVKETARRFFDSEEPVGSPNRCYLRQRHYIVVKQSSRTYPTFVDLASGKTAVEPFDARNFALQEVSFETLKTPPLDQNSTNDDHFWPTVGGKHFRFDITCTDQNEEGGKRLRLPFKWVSADIGQAYDEPSDKQLECLQALVDEYNDLTGIEDAQDVINTEDGGCSEFEQDDQYSRLSCAKAQKIHFAPAVVPADTELETHCIAMGASLVSDALLKDKSHALRKGNLPLFCPFTDQAQVHIPSVQMLQPRPERSIIKYHDTYNKHGFAARAVTTTPGARAMSQSGNVGEVFAQLVDQRNFDFPPDKGGGVALPNIGVTSLSRKLGPLAGDAQKFCDGIFAPLDFFNGLNARLLGVVDFGSVLQPLNDIRDQVKRIPQLIMQRLDGLASAADDQIRHILEQLQALVRPVIDALQVIANNINKYASTIKDSAGHEVEALKAQVDAFPDLWRQLQTLLGEDGLQSQQYNVALHDVPKQSLLFLVAGDGSDAIRPLASAKAKQRANPPDCISLPTMRDQIVGIMENNAQVSRDAVHQIQRVLDPTQEFDFVDQQGTTVKLSVVRLLSSVRTMYGSILSSLSDIPGTEIPNAIGNLLNDFEHLSIETIFVLPQHIGDLVVAFEKELNRVKKLAASVQDYPAAEFRLLTQTFESMAGNVVGEGKSVQDGLTNALAAMKGAATTTISTIQSQLGADYQQVIDLLQHLDKLASQCIVPLLGDKFDRLQRSVIDVQNKLENTQAQIVRVLKQLNDARNSVLGELSTIREIAFQPVELKLDYTFSPLLKDGPSGQPIFRANLQGRTATMDVTVQIRQQVTPATGALSGGSQTVDVVIRHFQIVLLPTPTFLIVKVNKVTFHSQIGNKPEVVVEIQGIELGDCLNFVKALQSAIPVLGNKGNGPFLDIGVREIAAGYRFGVSPFTLGALNVLNVAIEASVTLSLVGDPMAVRFAFCSRQRPFLLSAGIWGGGGFFAIELNAQRVTRLEASLEFGGVVALAFGPAHGTVTITCGIYFSIRPGSVELSGFFRAAGDMDVAGLIHLSLIFYMGLSYVSSGGSSYAHGQVTVHVEIGIGLIKVGYDLHAERQLAGSGNTQARVARTADIIRAVPAIECSTLHGIDETKWNEYLLAFA
jgi:hypothetical protein